MTIHVIKFSYQREKKIVSAILWHKKISANKKSIVTRVRKEQKLFTDLIKETAYSLNNSCDTLQVFNDIPVIGKKCFCNSY